MDYENICARSARLIDTDTVKVACRLDGVELNTLDTFQATLCVNTWAALGLDIGFPDWGLKLRSMLRRLGFSETVETCKRIFLNLATGENDWISDKGGELYQECCNYLQFSNVPHDMDVDTCLVYVDDELEADYRIPKKPTEAMLNLSELLRFPTRFTFLDPGNTEQTSYAKFLDANKSCYCAKDYRSRGIIDPRTPGVWEDVGKADDGSRLYVRLDPAISEGSGKYKPGNSLIMNVKRHVEDMLGCCPVDPIDSFVGFFSDGASAPSFMHDVGPKVKADKIKSLYEITNKFEDSDCGYFLPNVKHTKVGFRDRFLKHEAEGSPMIAVPKNLTSKRLIKPEPVFRAYKAAKIRKVIENQMTFTGGKYFLDWADQSVNKGYAQIGSVGFGWSTIDASAASDHQSRELTFMLLPEWLRSYVYDSLTDYVIVNGQKIRVRCLSTSGNQLTWLLLGVTMWAIADYGCSWYRRSDGSYMHPFAYGDDLVVPDRAYDTVVDLLELFGFVINKDKSYTGECPYRESCGGDYYLGYDITPKYWKRGAVDLRDYPRTMKFVCDLQHKLFSYKHCRDYLHAVAIVLDPKITYSPVGWECDDLWDGDVSVFEAITSEHRMLTSRKPVVDKYPQVVMDHQYFSFLKYGPRYDSPLSEQLGISMPYLDSTLIEEPTLRWTLVKPPYLFKKKG